MKRISEKMVNTKDHEQDSLQVPYLPVKSKLIV